MVEFERGLVQVGLAPCSFLLHAERRWQACAKTDPSVDGADRVFCREANIPPVGLKTRHGGVLSNNGVVNPVDVGGQPLSIVQRATAVSRVGGAGTRVSGDERAGISEGCVWTLRRRCAGVEGCVDAVRDIDEIARAHAVLEVSRGGAGACSAIDGGLCSG